VNGLQPHFAHHARPVAYAHEPQLRLNCEFEFRKYPPSLFRLFFTAPSQDFEEVLTALSDCTSLTRLRTKPKRGACRLLQGRTFAEHAYYRPLSHNLSKGSRTGTLEFLHNCWNARSGRDGQCLFVSLELLDEPCCILLDKDFNGRNLLPEV